METNYEKRGYLLDDFRLFHLKDKNGTISTIIITNFASCCSCAAAMAAIP